MFTMIYTNNTEKNLLKSLVYGDSQHSFTAVKFLYSELSLYTSYSACKLSMHAFYESIKTLHSYK